MNIGRAAEASGLPAKTIRYYEDIGLLTPERRANGYRTYGQADLTRLSFLKRARGLGFSVDDCRDLLSLYDDRDRASAAVKAIASEHLRAMDEKIAELQALRDTLAPLVENCPGDGGPACAILEGLAGEGVAE